MPLNPKIEQVLDMIARAKRPKLHEMTAQAARASYEKSAPILEIASAPMLPSKTCAYRRATAQRFARVFIRPSSRAGPSRLLR